MAGCRCIVEDQVGCSSSGWTVCETIANEISYSVKGEVCVPGEGIVEGGGCKDGCKAVPGVVEDSILEAEGNGMGRGARGEAAEDGVKSGDVRGFLGSVHQGCGIGCDVYSVVC